MKRVGQGGAVVFGVIAIALMTWFHHQQTSELAASFEQEDKTHIEHIMASVEREIEVIELKVSGVLHHIARQSEVAGAAGVNVIVAEARRDKALLKEIAHLQTSILLNDVIVTQDEGRFLSRAILATESATFDHIHIQKHYEWLSQDSALAGGAGQPKMISTTSDQRHSHLYYSLFTVKPAVGVAPVMVTFVIDIEQIQGLLLKGYYLQFDEIKYMADSSVERHVLVPSANTGAVYEFNETTGNRKLWGRWAVGVAHERQDANRLAFALLNDDYKLNVMWVIFFMIMLIVILEFSIRSNKLSNISNQKLREDLSQSELLLNESEERNQAINDDLLACEIKMHSIINASTDGVIVCNSHAVITNINQAIRDLFGYSEDDVLGKEVDFLFPDFSPKGLYNESLTDNSGKQCTARLVETNAISKDNIFLEVELYVTCVKISGNDLFTIIVRDISDRVKKQNKIRDVQENLRAVIDNIAEGIITSDEQGNILTFNPAAEIIFGWKASEILGKNVSTLMSTQDKEGHDGYLAKYIQSQHRRILGIGPREVIGVKKDGEPFHMELATSEMFSDKKRVFVAIFRDVSERKMIEKSMHMSYSELESVVDSHTDDLTKVNKELVKARDDALVAARSKAEFLAMMSHEIRTPINGVLGMLNLVRDTELNSEQRDYIEAAYSSGEILLALLNDVLDLSKIDAGRMTLDHNDFDLYQLVEMAVSIASKTLRDSNIEISCVISSEVPRSINGDSGCLRQVLSNLLSNAVKFTQHGGVLVKLSLDSTDEDGFILRFDVSDSGIGIEEIDCDMIFDAFMQADNSERRNYGGTGLGLSICKRFVLLMGGEISVSSVPGEGSCFTFTARVERSDLTNQFEEPTLHQVFVLSDHARLSDALMMQFKSWRIAVKQISEEELNAGLSGEQVTDQSLLVLALDPERHHDFDCYVKGLIDTAMNIKLKSLFVNIDGFCFNAIIGDLLDRDVSLVSRPVLPGELVAAIKRLQAGEGANLKQVTSIGSEAEDKTEIDIKEQDSHVTILVAEDNFVNQKVITAMLKKLGVGVDIANNGREALLALSTPDHPYRLVLMDCQMPEVDGYAATRQQRRLEKDNPDIKRIPIVAMTAHALPGDREKCLDAGMDDYITKPINLEVVRKVIEGWS